MHFLRGFDDTLMDCLLQPDIEEMAKKLADYQIGIIEEAYRLGKGRIHCYDTTDDWGTQQNLMVSPTVFREIFKPQYKEVSIRLTAAVWMYDSTRTERSMIFWRISLRWAWISSISTSPVW